MIGGVVTDVTALAPFFEATIYRGGEGCVVSSIMAFNYGGFGVLKVCGVRGFALEWREE